MPTICPPDLSALFIQKASPIKQFKEALTGIRKQLQSKYDEFRQCEVIKLSEYTHKSPEKFFDEKPVSNQSIKIL
jgi:hypothetical protein